METSGPRAIFGMLDGFKPITNLLGAGDPNVHKIDDQWWMFFGGFQKTLKNNLFSATLPKGEPLHNGMTWEITADPGRPHKALALVDQPDKGEWDHYGLHEPCFVDGLTASPEGQQVRCRRIYYAGRSSRRVLGNDAPYSIGFLESTSAGWWRHGEPVVVGDARNPSALGPKVLYADGKWRMWFRAAPQEPAKGDRPIAEIRYTESDDGVRGWTEPTSFSSRGRLRACVHVTVDRLLRDAAEQEPQSVRRVVLPTAEALAQHLEATQRRCCRVDHASSHSGGERRRGLVPGRLLRLEHLRRRLDSRTGTDPTVRLLHWRSLADQLAGVRRQVVGLVQAATGARTVPIHHRVLLIGPARVIEVAAPSGRQAGAGRQPGRGSARAPRAARRTSAPRAGRSRRASAR